MAGSKLSHRAARLVPFLEAFLPEEQTPGLAIGIVHRDEVICAAGFGVAALAEPARPVTADTLFHMGSITKPFVAAAIMQLVEHGRLSLDAPVARYLSYFQLASPGAQSVTLFQLLTHTSGLPDIKEYRAAANEEDDAVLERHVRGLREVALCHPPGARFTYSSLGFDVLGDVVAKAADMAFEDYVETNLFQTLGMTASSLRPGRVAPHQVATGHSPDDRGVISPVRYPYDRAHGPSSSLLSSATEMTRWIRAHLDRGELEGRRILQTSSYDRMWQPVAEVGRGDLRSAIGWFVSTVHGEQLVEHGGHNDGFICHLTLLPGQRTGFAILANQDYAPVLRVREHVLSVLMGWDDIQPVSIKPSTGDRQ